MTRYSDDEIDDLVAAWHAPPHVGKKTLTAFMAERLGWTEDDVNKWVADARYRPSSDVVHDDHLIGLECGHFWPGRGSTDDEARAFLVALMATGDSVRCSRCGSQQRVTGPLTKVLET